MIFYEQIHFWRKLKKTTLSYGRPSDTSVVIVYQTVDDNVKI